MYELFTLAALGVSRALTIIVRRLRTRVAAPTILAGGTGTACVGLAFLSHSQPWAVASRTRRCVDALLALLAFHLPTSTVAAELAFCSRITRRTLADEPIRHIAGNSTGASILTGLPGTHIYDTLTVTTSKSTTTDTCVIIYQLNAIQTSTRVTRIREAFIDIPLAPLACEAWETKAAVAPNLVNALPPIKAAGSS